MVAFDRRGDAGDGADPDAAALGGGSPPGVEYMPY